MIQILPYDLIEMRQRSVMLVIHLTSVVVFVEEHSLRVWQFILQTFGVNTTCQTLQENVRTNVLVFWSHESENASKQTEDTSKNFLQLLRDC